MEFEVLIEVHEELKIDRWIKFFRTRYKLCSLRNLLVNTSRPTSFLKS